MHHLYDLSPTPLLLFTQLNSLHLFAFSWTCQSYLCHGAFVFLVLFAWNIPMIFTWLLPLSPQVLILFLLGLPPSSYFPDLMFSIAFMTPELTISTWVILITVSVFPLKCKLNEFRDFFIVFTVLNHRTRDSKPMTSGWEEFLWIKQFQPNVISPEVNITPSGWYYLSLVILFFFFSSSFALLD